MVTPPHSYKLVSQARCCLPLRLAKLGNDNSLNGRTRNHTLVQGFGVGTEGSECPKIYRDTTRKNLATLVRATQRHLIWQSGNRRGQLAVRPSLTPNNLRLIKLRLHCREVYCQL